MQNLEKQVGQIFKMLKKTEDRSEKDAIIATLQSELNSASMKVEDLENNGQAKTVLQEKVYFNS